MKSFGGTRAYWTRASVSKMFFVAELVYVDLRNGVMHVTGRPQTHQLPRRATVLSPCNRAFVRVTFSRKRLIEAALRRDALSN